MSQEPMQDIRQILEERGTRYGEFPEHARLTQNLKLVMRSGRQWPYLTDSAKEALEMVAHKIGRILNGDPTYLDSWVDIIGYIQLEIDRLKKMKKAREVGQLIAETSPTPHPNYQS